MDDVLKKEIEDKLNFIYGVIKASKITFPMVNECCDRINDIKSLLNINKKAGVVVERLK